MNTRETAQKRIELLKAVVIGRGDLPASKAAKRRSPREYINDLAGIRQVIGKPALVADPVSVPGFWDRRITLIALRLSVIVRLYDANDCSWHSHRKSTG
jgi:hypothetical protein